MANPRIFISSTCYDLKYIRENIKYFVKTLGYEPVLSEEGAVFFDPQLHTHDACVAELPNCQMLVLIIGGRYGGKYKDTEHSITNAEYKEAVRLKIPVFALVEQAVHAEHFVYTKNLKNKEIELGKLNFPAVDNIKIFEFIDEVRRQAVNNAIVPFRDFSDIETYLRQQWAAMMYSFLTAKNENERLATTLDALSQVNERVQMLSEQILRSVGTPDAKLAAILYEVVNRPDNDVDYEIFEVRPSVSTYLLYPTYRASLKALGAEFEIDEEDTEEHSFTTRSGRPFAISRYGFDVNSGIYKKTREELLAILKQHDTKPEDFIKFQDTGISAT